MAGERVLIVDDEPSIQLLLDRLCREHGYEVALAGDGAGAFELLDEGAFEVGIVDLSLPDVHGLDILRRAKERYPDCEVIILTGNADLHSAVEALRLGAYDYLQKPLVDLQIIPLTISRALDRRRLSRRNDSLVEELRAAGRELEQRRRQQIQHIQQIGQALAGSLRSLDVAQVLIRAILGSVACDGAGVLLLANTGPQDPLAMTGAPRILSPRIRNGLLSGMLNHLPESLRPETSKIEVHALPTESTDLDDDEWRRREFRLLAVRDKTWGVAALVNHSHASFSEEDLGIFGILVSQGSIALENAYLFARMRELATKDSLTGLCNHGHFFELLEAEISRAERHGLELAVIMFDIDREHGLKIINDTYGHQAGDVLLHELAKLLQLCVRRADVVARYGGDEFVIMAPATAKGAARSLADRICKTIRETPFMVAGHHAHITASGGVAVFRSGVNDTASSLVALADQGSYLAKGLGGDQVAMIPPET